MKIKELKQKQADARKGARTLVDTAAKESRDLSAEEALKFDELKAEIARLQAQIEREEFLEAQDLAAAEASSGAASSRASGVPSPARVESVRDLAVERPWQQPGEFFRAIVSAGMPGAPTIDRRLFAGTPTGMNQNIPSEGGFLVPPEISNTIWDGMAMSPYNLLPLTDNYTVSGESLTVNANAETSRVNGSLYGGVQAYWISEADQITKSKPKFRQVRVEPHELAVLIYATDKLLANAGIPLEQYLTRCASAAINHLVNSAIVEGNGVGQPLGILNAGCVVSVAKETNQAAATIVQENVSKMWARMHPSARGTAVWLHNVDIEPQLDFLSTTVKNVAGTENVGGYANKVWDAERRTLKGRPLVPCEFCATIGTVGDIVLWDPKGYITATRGGVKTAVSMHVRFEYAETAFRFMFAVDGQPWLASAITPAKGSNSLTNVITLATRS